MTTLAVIGATSPWPAKRSRRSAITMSVAPPEPVVFHKIVMPAHYRNVWVESIVLGRLRLLEGDDPVPAEVFSSESIMCGVAAGMVIHPYIGLSISLRRMSSLKDTVRTVSVRRTRSGTLRVAILQQRGVSRRERLRFFVFVVPIDQEQSPCPR